MIFGQENIGDIKLISTNRWRFVWYNW